jgi:hypothetical protein
MSARVSMCGLLGKREFRPTLESRVDGLALEGEDTENAFVDAAKRFPPDESLQRFDIQCKLAQGE